MPGFSRQGNIYNGDTQNSSTHPAAEAFAQPYQLETAASTAATSPSPTPAPQIGATPNGPISYDRTTNSRLPEYLAGGPEGSYSSDEFTNSYLKNLRLSSEAHIPFEWACRRVS